MIVYKYIQDDYVLTIKEFDSWNYNFGIVFSGPLKNSRVLKPEVKLLAAYEKSHPRIYIEDVQGNGYYSGLQGKGIGTLLFNTALQVFNSKYNQDTEVYGELSTIDDPEELGEAKRCEIIRENFWRSFGFCIINGGRLGKIITAKLGNLRIKNSNELIEDVFPRFIEIEKFNIYKL